MTSLRNKSVLVIDDDESMLRALEKVLRGEGCTVNCARWADEALDLLADRQRQFDFVITDMRMPMISGKGILEAVRLALPKVPVIIITAYGSSELRSECLSRGAAAFLEKPLNTEQLVSAIKAVSPAPRPD